MTPIRSFGRLGRVRAALLATLGAAAILVACEARLPTDAEVQSMDAARAEKLYKLVPDGGPAAGVTNPVYYVDGHRVTAAEAHAIPASRIATVEVVGPRAASARRAVLTETRNAIVARLEAERHAAIERDDGPLPGGQVSSGQAEIRIVTVPENGAASVESGFALRAHGLTEEAGRTRTRGKVSTLDEHGFTGLLYIDGKRADASALHALDPASIASVEVLKGARARAVSSDPAAANGIIRVTTKR